LGVDGVLAVRRIGYVDGVGVVMGILLCEIDDEDVVVWRWGADWNKCSGNFK